jgi:hypothetical protein
MAARLVSADWPLNVMMALFWACCPCLGGCIPEIPVCRPSLERPAPGVLVGGQARIPSQAVLAGTDLSLGYDVPVNRGEVYLSDAAGRALPGRVALTGVTGTYLLTGIPPGTGIGVVVVAQGLDGRDYRLRSLVMPGAQGATADVNAATTIATVALTENISGVVGDFDRAGYERLVAMIFAKLADVARLDLRDAAAIRQQFRVWLVAEPELRTLVERLRVEISRPRLNVEEQARAILQAQGLPQAYTSFPDPEKPSQPAGVPSGN